MKPDLIWISSDWINSEYFFLETGPECASGNRVLMIMITWLEAWILFGGFLAAVLAGGQLLRPGRALNNLLLAALFLCAAVWQTIGGSYGALRLVDAIALANQLHLVATVAYFWTGPLLWLYFARALHSEFEWRSAHWLHFLPGLLVSIFYIIYCALYSASLSDEDFLYQPALLVLGYTSAISVVLYGLGVLVVLGRLLRTATALPRATTRMAVGLILGVVLLGVLEVAVAGDDLLNALATVVIIATYWVGSSHPALLQDLKDEADRVRYVHSQLEGLPVDALAHRLRDLMERDRIYRDENLSLRDLASQLEISSHHLSELLNSRFGKNFYAFVNGYRVERARELLISRPEMSVTAVGFEAGFNSNSVFYDAFRRFTGIAPGSYRKERRASAAVSTSS